MRYATVVICFLLSSALSAETVLFISSAGYFVGEMKDGQPPTEWAEVDHIWKVDGDGPAIPPVPTDKITDQVDTWSDATKDRATRAVLSIVWGSVIRDVKIENNNVTIDNADRHISAGAAPIVERLPAGQKAAWVLWSEKVADLIDKEKSRGTYTLATLESIHAGMVRQ